MAHPQNLKTVNGLTCRQQTVVDQFMSNGFREYEAMMVAGYTHKTADRQSRRFFDHPAVKAEIQRRMSILTRKSEITSEEVMRGLTRLATASERLAKFKKVDDRGQLHWDFTGATEDELGLIQELQGEVSYRGKHKIPVLKFKIGTGDAKAAYDSLARCLGMFTDKLEVTGEMSLVEKLNAGRARVGKKDA